MLTSLVKSGAMTYWTEDVEARYIAALDPNVSQPSVILSALQLTTAIVDTMLLREADQVSNTFRRILWRHLPPLFQHSSVIVQAAALHTCCSVLMKCLDAEEGPVWTMQLVDDVLIETNIISLEYIGFLVGTEEDTDRADQIGRILAVVYRRYAFREAWTLRFPHLLPLLLKICALPCQTMAVTISALELVHAMLSRSNNIKDQESPPPAPPLIKDYLIAHNFVPMLVRMLSCDSDRWSQELNAVVYRIFGYDGK
jgi:hypothetical protein